MLVGKILKQRYKIIQVLGSGGFGDTYLAEDTDLPRHPTCVVKQLKPKDTSTNILPIAKSLFEREAEYLYKLGHSHPQIPKLFAHFEENNEFFLVEEFVEGHSLEQEIPIGHRLSESATIALLIDILEVLAFVHQNNVIHRDIKLANLMRRQQDGKIVLIDFGAVKDISVLGTNSQGMTDVTVSIGSPGYMPSEQAKGKPRLSSDVYAVGMIGIQAITGIAPDSLQEDPQTGEVLWRNYAQVSEAFADVLQNMVFYHFNQRYKSATEALQAVRSLSPTNVSNSNYGNAVSGNIAPTEVISYSNPNLPTNPVSASHSQRTPPPDSTIIHPPATTPHATIADNSSKPTQLFLWLFLTGIVSVGAAIATAMIIPNFINSKADPSPQTQVRPTETPTVIASPRESITPPVITTPPVTPPPITNPSTTQSFGAIARSPSQQDKGYSWNYPTRQEAEARSLSECEKFGASDCQVMIWAANACLSISEGSNGAAGTAWSVDKTAAETKAKEVCQDFEGINCTITRTVCLPVTKTE